MLMDRSFPAIYDACKPLRNLVTSRFTFWHKQPPNLSTSGPAAHVLWICEMHARFYGVILLVTRAKPLARPLADLEVHIPSLNTLDLITTETGEFFATQLVSGIFTTLMEGRTDRGTEPLRRKGKAPRFLS